jgi:hypothetical protein
MQSAAGLVTGSCEHGNEILVSIKCGELFDHLNESAFQEGILFEVNHIRMIENTISSL